MPEKTSPQKPSYEKYLEWGQTIQDRSVAYGDGIRIKGRELGTLVQERMRNDKSPLLDTEVGTKGARVTKIDQRGGELSLMDAYAAVRSKHNAGYYRTYGHPAPKRLTDAIFDASHGAGAAQKAHKIADAYYRKEHLVRRQILEKAIADKSKILVNGVKFHVENSRWVTNETSAPPSLLSKSARLARGERGRDPRIKTLLYPSDADGLLKLSKETAPDFLALITAKMKERGRGLTLDGRLSKTGLKTAKLSGLPQESHRKDPKIFR